MSISDPAGASAIPRGRGDAGGHVEGGFDDQEEESLEQYLAHQELGGNVGRLRSVCGGSLRAILRHTASLGLPPSLFALGQFSR